MKIVSIIFTMLLLTGMYRVYPCTTWIIAPDGGQYGSAILHKNRDWGNGKEQPVTLEIIRPKKGYKYLQISPYMLFNEAGLALSNNAVAATKDPVYPERMNNRQVLEELAKTCATTQETTEKIKEIAAGGFSQAVIIAACDPDGGAFYELSSEHLAYQETASSSFDLRANDWTLPEMKQISGLKESAKKSSARRANVTRQALSQAVSSPFRLSVADCLRIARLQQPSHPDQCPFRNSTVSCATFLPDQEFPGELSVAFVCFGPPRMTAALPVPISLEKVPERAANGELGRLAYRIKKQFGMDNPRQQELIELENRWHDEYFTVRGEARLLLRKGRRKEAIEKLNQLFLKQEQELFSKLSDIVDSKTS